MEYLPWIIVIAALVFMVFMFIQNQKQKNDAGATKLLELMNQQMSENLKNVNQQLHTSESRMNERLKEMVETMQRQHQTVDKRLDNAAKAYTKVDSHLAKMQESNKRIYDVGKDISSLQELLKAPKLRGALGEYFLSDLLAQIFPESNFTMQYSFKSGEKVDAVIHVRDGLLIPVDAKFPLENFKKMLEEDNEAESKKLRKLFVSDVKKRIEEISSKYILPDEGTLDFALMYVPAENVYYEMIIKDQQNEKSISSFAVEKKVIPVSPNTFYIYLQTILMGLRGLQVEKQSKEILGSLSRLRGDFEKFGTDFTLVGTHIGRAKNSFDNSEKRLGRLSDKLYQAESLTPQNEDQKLLS